MTTVIKVRHMLPDGKLCGAPYYFKTKLDVKIGDKLYYEKAWKHPIIVVIETNVQNKYPKVEVNKTAEAWQNEQLWIKTKKVVPKNEFTKPVDQFQKEVDNIKPKSLWRALLSALGFKLKKK